MVRYPFSSSIIVFSGRAGKSISLRVSAFHRTRRWKCSQNLLLRPRSKCGEDIIEISQTVEEKTFEREKINKKKAKVIKGERAREKKRTKTQSSSTKFTLHCRKQYLVCRRDFLRKFG